MVNKLWLALEWYTHAIHVFDVMLVSTPCTKCNDGLHLNKFLAIYGKVSSKQASKKTDFTVDLTWWGSLRLAPIKLFY